MDFEAELQSASDEYRDRVFEIAKEAFERVVKPFCKARGIELIAGNGAYWFGPPFGKPVYREDADESDTELMKVLDVLEMGVPYWPSNDLGSLMPDYDPDEVS